MILCNRVYLEIFKWVNLEDKGWYCSVVTKTINGITQMWEKKPNSTNLLYDPRKCRISNLRFCCIRFYQILESPSPYCFEFFFLDLTLISEHVVMVFILKESRRQHWVHRGGEKSSAGGLQRCRWQSESGINGVVTMQGGTGREWRCQEAMAVCCGGSQVGVLPCAGLKFHFRDTQIWDQSKCTSKALRPKHSKEYHKIDQDLRAPRQNLKKGVAMALVASVKKSFVRSIFSLSCPQARCLLVVTELVLTRTWPHVPSFTRVEWTW